MCQPGRLHIVSPEGDISEPVSGVPRVYAQGHAQATELVRGLLIAPKEPGDRYVEAAAQAIELGGADAVAAQFEAGDLLGADFEDLADRFEAQLPLLPDVAQPRTDVAVEPLRKTFSRFAS